MQWKNVSEMTKRPYPMNNFSSQTKNKKKTEKLLICKQASVKKKIP